MKLRVSKNAIRIRLSEAEAAEWRTRPRLEEALEFQPGSRFVYAIERGRAAREITAIFEGGALRITVPETMADEWLNSSEEGLYSKISEGLSIAIERDLPCRHN